MNYILNWGDDVTGVYNSMLNGLYNNYSGIASAAGEADLIIKELNTFTCTGKFEMRRINAIKIMSKMRDDLKVALEKGMDQFDIAAKKSDHEYNLFCLIYPMWENIVYEHWLMVVFVFVAVAIVIVFRKTLS